MIGPYDTVLMVIERNLFEDSCKLRLKAPPVSQDRTYIITLKVTDDEKDIDTDSMKLTVKDGDGNNNDSNSKTTKITTTTDTDTTSKYRLYW